MLGNPFRRVALCRQVIVNLDDGTGIEGVFYRQAGPLICIRNALLLRHGEEPVPLDGEQIIERSRVLFIQAL
jgi:hypothetical protein